MARSARVGRRREALAVVAVTSLAAGGRRPLANQSGLGSSSGTPESVCLLARPGVTARVYSLRVANYYPESWR